MAEFEPFKLLSLNHVGSVFFCLLIIVFVPRFFVGASDKTLRLLGFGLVLLILHLQVLELYVFTRLYGREWKEILPLQLYDFAAWAIVVYFIWGYKFAFNCAYFWGVSGGRNGHFNAKRAFCVPLSRLLSSSIWAPNCFTGRVDRYDTRSSMHSR